MSVWYQGSSIINRQSPIFLTNPAHVASALPKTESKFLFPMLNITLRRKARQFTKLVRHSVITPRAGKTHRPTLASNGETALTFIGHSSFFVQVGGRNFVIDPNFAKWLFILKRLRRPGLHIKD